MPAATLGQLAATLSSYTTPEGPSFPDALMMVLKRAYNLGTWQDITDERVIQARADGTIPLPGDCDSVLYFLVNDRKAGPIRPLWHDYNAFSRTSRQPYGLGLIDAGFSVGNSYLDDSVGNYRLRFETENGTNFSGTEKFTIDFTDGDGVRAVETLEPTGVAFVLTAETDIATIHSIVWSGVDKRVRLELTNADTDLNDEEFGLISEPAGVLRTRRFRVSGANEGDDIRVLLKRKPPYLSKDTDIVDIGNENALKHGLLAVIAEDAADLERAQFHWGELMRIFNEELGSLNSGHEYVVYLDMTGGGSGHNPVQNLL